ncbi:hypothetical protein AB4Y87_00655 [Paenarthrobacter sp. RAF54_2]|uniref:hypothetical protein n=1 Tax=Paenarthrobacter sp. RAF54_2 TaxID=3233061 RepID=UPI003F96DEDE
MSLAIAPDSLILTCNSPFLTVMQDVGVRFADSLINVFVIVAALSDMNSQLRGPAHQGAILRIDAYTRKASQDQ